MYKHRYRGIRSIVLYCLHNIHYALYSVSVNRHIGFVQYVPCYLGELLIYECFTRGTTVLGCRCKGRGLSHSRCWCPDLVPPPFHSPPFVGWGLGVGRLDDAKGICSTAIWLHLVFFWQKKRVSVESKISEP